MKKMISNLSVIIFAIGCITVEVSTWFDDAYIMFFIGIVILMFGIIAMIIQGKIKEAIEFIIEYF